MIENKLNGICSTYGGDKKRIQIFVTEALKYIQFFFKVYVQLVIQLCAFVSKCCWF
jgi:hypothetical protein